jgi:phospholipid/cholesterol/gamma-HCH transport system ATP-binding protein
MTERLVPPPGGVAVEVRGLHKAYDQVPILRGIDLRVDPGDIVVIAGGSGEGKSVLLRHIAGLEAPDRGAVFLSGIEATEYIHLPPERKTFRLSMVFQGSALLNSLSVFDNVGLRLFERSDQTREEITRTVTRCLEQVGLTGEEHKLPEQLSGGMRKRVAIARALAAEPHLILYDEPTADLDPIRTVEMGDLILEIGDGSEATQIVVTHDLGLALKVGTRVAVMHEGTIVDDQPAKALRQSAHAHTRALLRAANLA